MRLWGVSGGVSGTWLEVCPGCGWGRLGERLRASGVQMGLKSFFSQAGLKSYVFAGGKKFERKRMTGQRVFVAILDSFGATEC